MLYRKRLLGKVKRIGDQWVTIDVNGALVGYEFGLFRDLPKVDDAVEIVTSINLTEEQPESPLSLDERRDRTALLVLQLFNREKPQPRAVVMPIIQSALDDVLAHFSAQYAVQFMIEDGVLAIGGEGFDEGIVLTEQGEKEIVELKKQYPDMAKE